VTASAPPSSRRRRPAENGRHLAAASEGASVTIEPRAAADQDTVEEIGRRLTAMLAEKGILINSPQCELGRRASDGASTTIKAAAVAGQYTVEEIVAMVAKKGIPINSPSACDAAIGHVAFCYTDSIGTRNQFSAIANRAGKPGRGGANYREYPSFFAVGRALGLHHQTVQRCVERAVVEGPMRRSRSPRQGADDHA